MYNTCTTIKTSHAVIRLLCEFTITKWLDTGFNHATSGIWHSNNCSPAASPATAVETYQSFVMSMCGVSPLIIARERKKRVTYIIYMCRDGMTHSDQRSFLHIWLPMVSTWVITAMNSGNEYLMVFMMILINYSNEFCWAWTNTIFWKISNYVM